MPSFADSITQKFLWNQKLPVSKDRQIVIDDVLEKLDPNDPEQVLAAHAAITRMGTIDKLWDTYVRGGTKAQSLDAAATLIIFAYADKRGATVDKVLKPRDAAQQVLAANLSLTGREVLQQSFLGCDKENVFLKYFALKDRECLDCLAEQRDIERCGTKDFPNASIEKDASTDTTAGSADQLVEASLGSWTTEKRLNVAEEVWTHARECEKKRAFKAAAAAYVRGAKLFKACGYTKDAAELHFKAAKHYAGCHAQTNDPEDARAARDCMTLAADGLKTAGWNRRAELVEAERDQFCKRVGLPEVVREQPANSSSVVSASPR